MNEDARIKIFYNYVLCPWGFRIIDWVPSYFNCKRNHFTIITLTQPQQESTELSDSINDSALANLSQALQEDKEDGDQNGGENWDKAINNLEDEMGFPVDEDVEEALMNITEVHLNNMSIQ